MIVGDIGIHGCQSGRAILVEHGALFDVVYYEDVSVDLVKMLREKCGSRSATARTPRDGAASSLGHRAN